MTKTLIITGMHRSGTSFFASYMQKCGLFLGHNLMRGDIGNPNGYFEDTRIVDFHNSLLSKVGLDYFPTDIDQFKRIDFGTQGFQNIYDILRTEGRDNALIGWKDPRTSLFLNYWKEVVEEPGYIFLIRSPTNVFDSLLRRGTDPLLLKSPVRILKSYKLYNRLILDFYLENRRKCVVVPIDTFIDNFEKVIEVIQSKLDIALAPKELDTLFDRSGIKLDHFRLGFFKRHRYKRELAAAYKIYQDLLELV